MRRNRAVKRIIIPFTRRRPASGTRRRRESVDCPMPRITDGPAVVRMEEGARGSVRSRVLEETPRVDDEHPVNLIFGDTALPERR